MFFKRKKDINELFMDFAKEFAKYDLEGQKFLVRKLKELYRKEED